MKCLTGPRYNLHKVILTKVLQIFVVGVPRGHISPWLSFHCQWNLAWWSDVATSTPSFSTTSTICTMARAVQPWLALLQQVYHHVFWSREQLFLLNLKTLWVIKTPSLELFPIGRKYVVTTTIARSRYQSWESGNPLWMDLPPPSQPAHKSHPRNLNPNWTTLDPDCQPPSYF